MKLHRLTAVLSVFILLNILSVSCFADCNITATKDAVTAFNVPSSAALVTALFNAGGFVGAKMYQGSGTVTADFGSDMSGSIQKADTLKAFVWDMKTLSPLSSSFEWNISELTSEEKTNKMKITAGGKEFIAVLEDNETAGALKSMLPMTVNMLELNGNEKYYYLSQNLPTNTQRVGTIHAGDIMLWGSNCIVIFYETFNTSYSYTKIGHIDDITDLKSALGNGSVTVTIL